MNAQNENSIDANGHTTLKPEDCVVSFSEFEKQLANSHRDRCLRFLSVIESTFPLLSDMLEDYQSDPERFQSEYDNKLPLYLIPKNGMNNALSRWRSAGRPKLEWPETFLQELRQGTCL